MGHVGPEGGATEAHIAEQKKGLVFEDAIPVRLSTRLDIPSLTD